MPTGYTAAVKDGEITELSDFAMRCARAFGAYVMVRDAGLNTEVPDHFEPDEYYLKRYEEDKQKLEDFKSMSDKELREQWNREHEESVEFFHKRKRDEQRDRDRYKNMLEQVLEWEPPTEDHVSLKRFMVDQLNESIRFDCSYYQDKQPPVQQSFENWKEMMLGIYEDDVQRSKEGWEKEQERVSSRNQWISELKESLNETSLA